MKNEELNKQIDDKIQYYLTKVYARKLGPGAINHANCTCYLPMFSVSYSNKSGKIRLVWDAAAISNGMCLNDALNKAPNQMMILPYVLYIFREEKVAVTADVAEMFQIQVK